MDVERARELREKMEQEVLGLAQEFERQTGLLIADLTVRTIVSHPYSYGPDGALLDPMVEVRALEARSTVVL